MTDIYQPLDRKVFRVLKAYAKRLIMQRANNNPAATRTESDAFQDLVATWANL
jgi:hypothetical protein